MPFLPVLQAAPAAAGSAAGLASLLPILLIFVIFYFLLIRPQNKKQKELERQVAALKKGDKVVTAGGIHGVVSSTKEKTIIVKVDENTKIEFSRSAISGIVSEEDKAEKKGKNDKKAEKKADLIEENKESDTESSEEKK